VVCTGCFDKKLEIDQLKAEITRLQGQVRYGQKIKKKDVVGAHTPSSKVPFKKNSDKDERGKRGGAKVGHAGHGRKRASPCDGDEIIESKARAQECGDCGGRLHCLGVRERSVVEAMPIKAKRVLYRIARFRCSKCRKVTEAKPPLVARQMYGDRLLSQAATMHYLHGVPIGRLIEIFGTNVTEGGILQAFHRLGKICAKASPGLVEQYRKGPVRHADETAWRNDGHSGYAWLFATPDVSLLEFTDTRSARVPNKILGDEKLAGVLVVDRYPAYNRAPVQLQYCYAHLLREVEKLDDEFSEDAEVSAFTSAFIPLLTQAMKLRTLPIEDDEFYRRAQQLKSEIIRFAKLSTYRHLAIKRVQQIFCDNQARLYHWVTSRNVPADNNRAERELRPTVIARKVSFGSQSDAGARTRGAMMSVLFTARKRLAPNIAVEEWFKQALDKIAEDPSKNILDLLPPPAS
jgi:transposase